jgi:hypothetical protein
MDRNEQLTPNFKAGEFLHSETAEKAGIPFPDPPADIEANIRKTAAKAQEARDILGVPVDIHNGWRPNAPVDINKLVGGSPTSAHVEGLAADLFPVGMALLDAIKKLTGHPTFMVGVDQIINERGCIHVGLPCKASGYEARNQVRTESWAMNPITKKSERHYPLLYVWKPDPGGGHA